MYTFFSSETSVAGTPSGLGSRPFSHLSCFWTKWMAIGVSHKAAPMARDVTKVLLVIAWCCFFCSSDNGWPPPNILSGVCAVFAVSLVACSACPACSACSACSLQLRIVAGVWMSGRISCSKTVGSDMHMWSEVPRLRGRNFGAFFFGSFPGFLGSEDSVLQQQRRTVKRERLKKQKGGTNERQ